VKFVDFEDGDYDGDLSHWQLWKNGGKISKTTEYKHSGNYGLKWEYTLRNEGDFSATFVFQEWNLYGANTLQFWIKPDGLPRTLVLQFNGTPVSNHDCWDVFYYLPEGDTTPRVVSIPIADFQRRRVVQRRGGVFDGEQINLLGPRGICNVPGIHRSCRHQHGVYR
jgi:hypothetical protein